MDREDQGASGRDSDDDWAGDPDADRLRGWISPDDRLWRHPSESGGAAAEPRATPPGGAVPRSRTGSWIIGGATACFVLALVAAGLIVATTAGNYGGAPTGGERIGLTSAPTTESGASRVPGRSTIDALVDAVQPSTVALLMSGSQRHWRSAGLVAESGGMIVTAASALLGARTIEAVEADGTRRPATVVARDASSGLAVVQTADDLPAADFDGAVPPSGKSAVALSLEPPRRDSTRPGADVYSGTVVAEGPVTAGGLSTIALMAPLSTDDIGCPLIDGNGQVSGMLMSVEHSGSSTVSVFLPAQLVLDVAQQLVDSGHVDHGWLGIEVTEARPAAVSTTTAAARVSSTSSSSAGVEVVAMLPGSPVATSGMVAGDVITTVDGTAVDSGAQLETVLYADSPGTVVHIQYWQGSTGPETAFVTLASGSGGAPVLSSSP